MPKPNSKRYRLFKRIHPLTELQAERFWEKVQKADGCWLWTGTKGPAGYGQFAATHNKTLVASRVSYYLHYRKDPRHLQVCHSCDNPTCVNPDHLWLGTAKDNKADSIRKGRANVGIRNARALAKLKVEEVREIRSSYTGRYGEAVSLARKYGISADIIRNIVNDEIWRIPEAYPPNWIPSVRKRKYPGFIHTTSSAERIARQANHRSPFLLVTKPANSGVSSPRT